MRSMLSPILLAAIGCVLCNWAISGPSASRARSAPPVHRMKRALVGLSSHAGEGLRFAGSAEPDRFPERVFEQTGGLMSISPVGSLSGVSIPDPCQSRERAPGVSEIQGRCAPRLRPASAGLTRRSCPAGAT